MTENQTKSLLRKLSLIELWLAIIALLGVVDLFIGG